jgi:hypothetical protein
VSRALRLLLLAAASGLLAACMARPEAAVATSEPTRFGKSEAELDPQRWLGPDSARATAAGADRSQVLAVEAGTAGDRVGSMVNAPSGECVLLMSRGAQSVQDIDLYAYAEDGTVLGADERPDQTPSLLVCPPHPRRMYVVARIAAGHGVIALGAQRVRVADADRVARETIRAEGPHTDSGRFAAWPGLDEKIAQRRLALGSAWQDVRRVALPVNPRLTSHVSATIDANRCLDVLVVPSDSVAHLDVSVLDSDGRIVGRAGAHGRDRALALCSSTPTTVSVAVRPHSGAGLVAVVLSRSEQAAMGQLELSGFTYDLAPTQTLDEARAKHADRLSRVGYGKAKVVATGTLAVGRRTSAALVLPDGCARIDLLAGRPVRAVQTWLWTEDGHLLAKQKGTGRVNLFACSPGGRARLDAEALSMPGRYVIELRHEPGAPPLLQRHPLAASRLLDRMLQRGVIQRPGQLGAAHLVRLRPDRLHVESVLVPVGRCVDFTLALGPAAAGAEIRLVDSEDSSHAALARGTYSAATRSCALDQPRTLRLRAELRCAVGETQALVATRMLAPKH